MITPPLNEGGVWLPKRDRFGRPTVPGPNGKPVSMTRYTTLAKTHDDTFHLGEWGKRMVAVGLGQREDLLEQVKTIPPRMAKHEPHKRTLNDICSEAMTAAESGRAARLGNTLHSWTERLDTNDATLDDVPEQFGASLTAYVEIASDWEILGRELFTVNDAVGAAGSPDTVIATPDGPTIVDLKTGSDVEYGMPNIAMQLAVNARANHRITEKGDRVEMPADMNTLYGYVVHMPVEQPGIVRLYQVALAEAWEMCKLAVEVREWRKNKSIWTIEESAGVSEVPAPPEKVPEAPKRPATHWEAVVYRIDVIGAHSDARAALKRSWPIGVGRPQHDTDVDTLLALEAVLSAVEAEFELPFPVLPQTALTTERRSQ